MRPHIKFNQNRIKFWGRGRYDWTSFIRWGLLSKKLRFSEAIKCMNEFLNYLCACLHFFSFAHIQESFSPSNLPNALICHLSLKGKRRRGLRGSEGSRINEVRKMGEAHVPSSTPSLLDNLPKPSASITHSLAISSPNPNFWITYPNLQPA